MRHPGVIAEYERARLTGSSTRQQKGTATQRCSVLARVSWTSSVLDEERKQVARG
jgi:hypothetical protein